MEETLEIHRGAAGLRALLARALHLDSAAYARLSQLENLSQPAVDVFVSTPFECIASRRIIGTVSRDGAVVPASLLAERLSQEPEIFSEDHVGESRVGGSQVDGSQLRIGRSQDAQWIGALPPKTGFLEREIVPVTAVRQLADQGRALARQFSGPMGPPKSLLNQVVLTVSDDGPGRGEVDIPMRMVFACTSLGLIPGPGAPQSVPRHLRVSTCGRWIRLDAPYGSVYHTPQLSLFV
ncbi:hypothetical protein [Corynebacterium aquatimens]|uniref:Uncharacterized protein n=1 Tax=Corynebacterium aquatimens TaxID=1190508 RepID=A0A931E0V4_9CORY|nr:hypothetical protein [Corynebacterium aquatimens]MBG6122213.1 hypothetical protein [Corynebacterium aquatimens]WJY65246.1 hypothetical protein CAQUA_02635 [Corynebacterium aquatimens]